MFSSTLPALLLLTLPAAFAVPTAPMKPAAGGASPPPPSLSTATGDKPLPDLSADIVGNVGGQPKVTPEDLALEKQLEGAAPKTDATPVHSGASVTIDSAASYDKAFKAMTFKLGEGVRRQEIDMSGGGPDAAKEWTSMLDSDEDGVITEDELGSMAFVNDEEDRDDLAQVNAMMKYYLSKPQNMKAWKSKLEEEAGMVIESNPFEWFKLSGFFKVYHDMYDRNHDGKVTKQEMADPLTPPGQPTHHKPTHHAAPHHKQAGHPGTGSHQAHHPTAAHHTGQHPTAKKHG